MAKKEETKRGVDFAVPKENYKYLLIGFVIITVGYLLMIGGGSKDPNVFNKDMFDTQRTVISPIVVLFGYAFEIWAIMRTPKVEVS